MTVRNYEDLKQHVGHHIVCVRYGDENVSVECDTCGVVLFDFDREEKPQNVEVYDNEGKTFDRYTVIIKDIAYGMSLQPQSPQGLNLYYGNVKNINKSNLGKKVDFENLPEEVQQAIIERMKHE